MPAFSAWAIAGALVDGSIAHPITIAAYPWWIAFSIAVLCSAVVPWLSKIVGTMPAALAKFEAACAISSHAASALTPGMIMIFFPARLAMLGTLPP